MNPYHLATMTNDLKSHTSSVDIRVRYSECDPMGVAHHSIYPVWFEMGRTELLRDSSTRTYRDMEAQGAFLVVASLEIKYRRAARYDEELTLQTSLLEVGRAKIRHAYELRRDKEVIATGATTLACVDAQGSVIPLPDWLTDSITNENAAGP